MAAMTSSAYARKKQPDVVRRAILDEAARLATHGTAAITIAAVAAAAGITKGGVFHHFANKEALIDGMFADVIARLDLAIDRCLATDSGHGCFTRAYIDTLMVGPEFGIGSPFDAIALTTLTDPRTAAAWENWIGRRLEQHRATDNDPTLEIARYAADGAWLAHMGSRPGDTLNALRDRLFAMTR